MSLTLLFRLDANLYGLEIDFIQEIIERPELYYAPMAEGVLKGAINFHGQILSVIDLPELLGFMDEQRDHRHVVLTQHNKSMVLLVTRVERIVNLDLSSAEAASVEEKDKAVRELIDFEEGIVNMLDTENIIERLEKSFAG